MTRALLLFFLLTCAACSERPDPGSPSVSLIGEAEGNSDADRGMLSSAQGEVVRATHQGLVRFDAAGQIVPGLAIRWAVSDDGLFYTFRLDQATGVSADAVAKRLRAAIAPRSENPLKPVLGAIDEIVVVTPEVIELRLSTPRPNLLDLFAQPELGMKGEPGTGPFRITHDGKGLIQIEAKPPDMTEQLPMAKDAGRVTLRVEDAGHAVARFLFGRTPLVLGGRLETLAIARAADLRRRDLRFDPVSGLMGLVVIRPTGFLQVAANRRALAMAIDRDAILASFPVPGWQSATSIVAPGTIELPDPTKPDWNEAPLVDRQTAARATIDLWRKLHGDAPMLTIAMPKGPGAKLLFALIRRDWAAVGITPKAVSAEDKADLRLIDEVAPSGSAAWYLRQFECVRSIVCDPNADDALSAARAAPSPAERSTRLSEADARMTAAALYLPIAQPVRWSLVAPSITGFQSNVRGVHPLDHLR